VKRGRFDVVRPPVKAASPLDRVGIIHQLAASPGERIVEGVDVIKATVGYRFIGQGPNTLARLQLGRVRRQVHEVDVVGHLAAVLSGVVPSCSVDDEHDLTMWARIYVGGEELERYPKGLPVHDG
jgi:hypothetical protein